jgi:hypothetical protein
MGNLCTNEGVTRSAQGAAVTSDAILPTPPKLTLEDFDAD